MITSNPREPSARARTRPKVASSSMMSKGRADTGAVESVIAASRGTAALIVAGQRTACTRRGVLFGGDRRQRQADAHFGAFVGVHRGQFAVQPLGGGLGQREANAQPALLLALAEHAARPADGEARTLVAHPQLQPAALVAHAQRHSLRAAR